MRGDYKDDIVEYELRSDVNGKEQAINVSLLYRSEYAVKLSKLKFKDFGLDVSNNIHQIAINIDFSFIGQVSN